jgi:hypothetical protein
MQTSPITAENGFQLLRCQSDPRRGQRHEIFAQAGMQTIADLQVGCLVTGLNRTRCFDVR